MRRLSYYVCRQDRHDLGSVLSHHAGQKPQIVSITHAEVSGCFNFHGAEEERNRQRRLTWQVCRRRCRSRWVRGWVCRTGPGAIFTFRRTRRGTKSSTIGELRTAKLPKWSAPPPAAPAPGFSSRSAGKRARRTLSKARVASSSGLIAAACLQQMAETTLSPASRYAKTGG